MVTSATSLTRSGLKDWLIQRVSAVVLALYVLFLGWFFLAHPGLTYTEWHAFFGNDWVRLFSLLTLLALLAHAWIGMWTIGTDYIRQHYFGASANVVRFIYEAACALAMFVFLVVGARILWSI